MSRISCINSIRVSSDGCAFVEFPLLLDLQLIIIEDICKAFAEELSSLGFGIFNNIFTQKIIFCWKLTNATFLVTQ